MTVDHNSILRFLTACGLAAMETAEPVLLAGDGSDRYFCRIPLKNGVRVIVVAPSRVDRQSLREAESYYAIGTHLRQRSIPVPKLYGFDRGSGMVITEDLGDTLLQQVAVKGQDNLPLYRQIIDLLVELQVEGVKGFRPEMCWDTPVYDRQLMLEREARYFERAFCVDLAGLSFDRHDLDREFGMIIDQASRQPADFFLHRDFQSRNLMLHGGRIRIIDFQGARFGPLAYDLAALLIDPYVDLSADLRSELLHYYIAQAGKRFGLNAETFLQGYYYIALLRNLQIIGAFAFLFQKKGKVFFRDYLKPAVRSLQLHLQEPAGADFFCLINLAAAGRAWLDRNI